MKYIIPAILCAFFIATFTFAQGTGTINQLDQWRRTSTGQITQNIANSVIKLTGYESSGDCLVTDSNGVVSTSSCGTGGGASSTIIKIGGTVSNAGTPTLDFGDGITVSESPTDEFNLSVSLPVYLASSSSWGTNQLTFVASNGAITGTSSPSVTSINSTSTVATSTLANIIVQKLQALTSAGLTFFSNGGTPIADFGAGGGAGVQFYNGVNIDGTTRLATSLNGLLTTTNGTVSNIATSSLGLVGGSGTVGQVAFFTGGQTLGSVATSTFTASGNLTITGTPGVFGTGSIAPTTGFTLASTTGLTNLYSFYDTPSTRITAGTGIDWSGNTLNGVYTAGDALTLTGEDFDFDGGATPQGELGGTWASPTLDDSVAVTSWNLTTPTLTSFFGTPCTGNQFLQDIGDTGTFSCATAGGGSGSIGTTSALVAGQVMFATGASTTASRATTTLVAGTGISFTGGTPIIIGDSPITIESTGGGGGGGALSTSTDIVGDGPASTVSYVTTDVMFGGSASTSAEFQFDKDGSKLIISSTTAAASTTIANTSGAASVVLGIASSTQYANPLVRGIHFAFQSTTQIIVSAIGGMTDFVLQLNLYVQTGKNIFLGTTKWNNGDFIEGAAIASSTIASSSLRVGGTATNGYFLAASSTASGGMSWTQFLVNLTSQVTGVLPVANGGTGTSTPTLLYKPSAIQVTSGSAAITTGDGKAYFRIPKEYNGMNLIDVDVAVTASSTSGYIEVQLARGRQASAGVPHTFSDMLSTRVTIDQNEYDSQYSATTTVINTSNDDVLDGDLIRIDVDRVGSGPSAVLIVQPVFGLP